MAGWYRGEDDTTSGIEGDNDYFVIKADNKLTKSTTLGFFGIYTALEKDDTSR